MRFSLLVFFTWTLFPAADPLRAQPVWEPVPLRTAQTKEAGDQGGEGCQWPLALAVDSVDGQTLFFGTDVGGVYRSEDGGRNWTPANLGLKARGANCIAIDPRNRDRVLLTACNSLSRPTHGLYLSTNRGTSWKSVRPASNLGYRDVREQIAFDPSSYQEAEKKCAVVYWSLETAKEKAGSLSKSTDGGETWSDIPGTGGVGGSILKVHPTKGWVYAGGQAGLQVSKDGGATFATLFPEPVCGLDVIPSAPENVYLSTAREVLVSTDAGATFTPVKGVPAGAGQPGSAGMKFLKVSPVNPAFMVVNVDLGKWNTGRFYTHDGGATWQAAKFEVNDSFIANNNRPTVFQWHPTDASIAWAFGGDFMTRSSDGGATWTWSNNGYTGIMVGRAFNFNSINPDLLLFPSQDYDAALTTNGGDTWKHLRFSGQNWGGFIYGGYAASADLVFAGNRTGWGGPTELRITRDGGGSYENTGIIVKGETVGFGAPTDENVLFFADHRSSDQGKTWAPMTGCRGVFTANTVNPEELFGSDGKSIVASTDKGVTWVKVATLDQPVRDIAFDPVQQVFYAATGSNLFSVDRASQVVTDLTSRLGADQQGGRGAASVAIDPAAPHIVYTCYATNKDLGDASCQRSVDGGQTWQTLTRNLRDSVVTSGPDGGRESEWVRVHPRTHYAYFGTNCFGLWKIGPPAAK